LLSNISKRKKEKKESSCISNADKKTKSRSRINDGFVRWGCVYGGCLFVFFTGLCGGLHCYFCELFLYFIFLVGYLLLLLNEFKIFLLYFCILLLMKNNCSLPAVTADLRPPLRPWLAG